MSPTNAQVGLAANQQKGDGDAATWLPANKEFRCDYVARQVAVKAEYKLWVTQAEHDAIEDILLVCPDTKIPNRRGTAAHHRQHRRHTGTSYQ